MAIKTMSASTGGSKFTEGWHECTIRKAEYGTFEGNGTSKRYLDLWFEDYPDTHNLRVYETFNKETKEEFKLANIFKFANAGIVGVLKDPNGKHPLIQYDDDEKGLIGKTINTFVYKETKTGEGYTRIFDNIAPVVLESEHLTFTTDTVAAIKKSVQERCIKYNTPVVSNGTSEEPWDDGLPA